MRSFDCIKIYNSLTPWLHKNLLVSCDSFLLQLGSNLRVCHNGLQRFLGSRHFEVASAVREETSEFTQIEANDRALSAKVWGVASLVVLEECYLLFDELKVFRNIEVDKCRLPEFFSMHCAPRVLVLWNLLFPFFKRTEFLVVSIEKFEESIKAVSDVFIHPGSVLKLDHKVECVNHAQVIKTLFVLFKVLKEHAHDPHDLLFVVVIEDLLNVLNDVESVVSEIHKWEFVVGQNPAHSNHVVSNLVILNALNS